METREKGKPRYQSRNPPASECASIRFCLVLHGLSLCRKMKVGFIMSTSQLLTFFDCLNYEANVSEYWRILEVQIHALWRQNCVRWVQWVVQELVKVPSWDGDLKNTSRRMLKCLLAHKFGPTFHIRRYLPTRRSLVAAKIFWSANAVGRGCPSVVPIVIS